MSSGGEFALQKRVDGVARERGWRRMAQATAPRGSTKGWPDRCYFRRGHVIVLEFKAEKDFKLSAEQDEWLQEWDALAAIANDRAEGIVRVAIVRPSDYDQIIRWFA